MSWGKSDASSIREELARSGLQTWGFFIYRTCYYNDDARWEQFLERLKELAKERLVNSASAGPDGDVIWGQLQWNVQQDPLWENCSKEEIWQQHRTLMQSLYGDYQPGFVHHGYAIMVDKEALDSVLEAKAPGTWGLQDITSCNAHVIVLDISWFDQEEKSRERRLENSDEEGDDEDWGGDDEVGWKKVLVTKIYPRLYSFCISDLWHAIHEKPPTVARLS